MRAHKILRRDAEIIVALGLTHAAQLRHRLHETLIARAGGVGVEAVVAGDAGVGAGPNPSAEDAMITQRPWREDDQSEEEHGGADRKRPAAAVGYCEGGEDAKRDGKTDGTGP